MLPPLVQPNCRLQKLLFPDILYCIFCSLFPMFVKQLDTPQLMPLVVLELMAMLKVSQHLHSFHLTVHNELGWEKVFKNVDF